MLRTLPVLLLLLSLALAAGATEREAPLEEFDLADYRGQVVVVDFWASWCPPCREAMPFLSDMQEKYGDQGLVTVAVNVDQDPKAPRKMIARLNDEIIVVRDPRGTLAQEHGVRGLPTALVLDREGNVVATHVGFHASEKGPREQELQRLLATEVSQG
jgi:cytochrome c biogenesis protein CcmG, thiol:disulfide interchange protein DsbE